MENTGITMDEIIDFYEKLGIKDSRPNDSFNIPTAFDDVQIITTNSTKQSSDN